MFKKNKAQGISITTIIVAAIALVVLVVLIAVFAGKMRIFGAETANCENQGGECVLAKDCVGENKQEIRRTDCGERFKTEKKDVCCINLAITPP